MISMILVSISLSQNPHSNDCLGFLDFMRALNVNYDYVDYYETSYYFNNGCCDNSVYSNVECDGGYRIIGADFSGLTLNGYVDMSKLPPLIKRLVLSDNILTGSISSIPSTMQVFQVQNNKLTGSLPVLPNGLKYLGISNNNLTGTLPTLPYYITDVFIGPGNQLSGSVNVSKPYNLNLKDNLIYDLHINNATSLVTCNLDNTPLLGKVDSLTMC